MGLHIDTFLSGPRDQEARQYLVLKGLKEYYDEFSRSRLYPALSELVDLYGSIEDLLQKRDDVQQSHAHVRDIDVAHQRLILEAGQDNDVDIRGMLDLMRWALPLIRKAIEEGTSIYSFVDEHVGVAEVGILPMYRSEGYWLVADSRAHQWHVIRYEMSLFSSASERYRTLKTRDIETLELDSLTASPEAIKLGLVGRYPDLPNPATYVTETDLDFPYSETILPVAKRKLMARLFS